VFIASPFGVVALTAGLWGDGMIDGGDLHAVAVHAGAFARLAIQRVSSERQVEPLRHLYLPSQSIVVALLFAKSRYPPFRAML
jgi:hypothetical protein